MEDGVVANETMVLEPCPEAETSSQEIEKLGGGSDDPSEAVVKDVGPPDGGYGWVVVGYVLTMQMEVMVGLFVC